MVGLFPQLFCTITQSDRAIVEETPPLRSAPTGRKRPQQRNPRGMGGWAWTKNRNHISIRKKLGRHGCENDIMTQQTQHNQTNPHYNTWEEARETVLQHSNTYQTYMYNLTENNLEATSWRYPIWFHPIGLRQLGWHSLDQITWVDPLAWDYTAFGWKHIWVEIAWLSSSGRNRHLWCALWEALLDFLEALVGSLGLPTDSLQPENSNLKMINPYKQEHHFHMSIYGHSVLQKGPAGTGCEVLCRNDFLIPQFRSQMCCDLNTFLIQFCWQFYRGFAWPSCLPSVSLFDDCFNFPYSWWCYIKSV